MPRFENSFFLTMKEARQLEKFSESEFSKWKILRNLKQEQYKNFIILIILIQANFQNENQIIKVLNLFLVKQPMRLNH